MDERTSIEVPETTAQSPMGLAVPPEGHRVAISPLNARRWQNFKANRRGYAAFWIFLVLFVVSLFAEFIANDKPIFIHYDGKSYFPIFVTYPDTEFGDDIGTAADYRDEHLQNFLDQHHAVEIWPPIRFSYNTINDKPPSPFPAKPTWMLSEKDCAFAAKNGYGKCGALEYNWLGTDDQGRDVLARMIYGFRLSVLFGLALTIVSSIIGVAAGAVQGYFGGWTDLLFQRFIEILTSVPELYLLLIISSVLVPGFFVMLGILLLFSWTRLVGLVRAEFLRCRNFEYIQAARALGASRLRLVVRHILPNALGPVIVAGTIEVANAIIAESTLSFLGLGFPPDIPTWGRVLFDAKDYLDIAPHWALFPGAAIFLAVLSINFIGDGLRDALDARRVL